MSQPTRYDDDTVTPETVQALARLLRLPVPPEDVAQLRDALFEQLELIAKLDDLDLDHASPAFQFNPRWEDDDDRAP